MKRLHEAYGRIGDEDDRAFDIAFWQPQGPQAIFEAALEMIRDCQILRYGHADEPRLQRDVEYYGKVHGSD